MALQFSTIGFINFKKDYNKIFTNGSITVSFTASERDKDGNYKTVYFNGLVPAKLVEKIKPFINGKDLLLIEGVASPAPKGYTNFTILSVEEFRKNQQVDKTEQGLPF